MYEIPIEKKEGMNVPGLIIASEELMKGIMEDEEVIEQVKNVAKLPGIIGKSIAMQDAHRGYGFCIGGVAAFDLDKGIISPGGVGYDIGCGVRLLSTGLSKQNFLKKREQVLSEINKKVPSGLGKGGTIKLSDKELNEILEKGVKWAVENNYAFKEDLGRIEDNGCIEGADASKISMRAKARGRSQIGTLGSGNHFLDIQYVEEIYDKKIAEVFGLKKDEIVIMIHTGSRGLGHQTASDYIRVMEKKQDINKLPDRELIYAPLKSQEAEDYKKANRSKAEIMTGGEFSDKSPLYFLNFNGADIDSANGSKIKILAQTQKDKERVNVTAAKTEQYKAKHSAGTGIFKIKNNQQYGDINEWDVFYKYSPDIINFFENSEIGFITGMTTTEKDFDDIKVKDFTLEQKLKLGIDFDENRLRMYGELIGINWTGNEKLKSLKLL